MVWSCDRDFFNYITCIFTNHLNSFTLSFLSWILVSKSAVTAVRHSHAQQAFRAVLSEQLNNIKVAGTWKAERVITSKQGVEINVQGSSNKILNFCANNYLGLSVNHFFVLCNGYYFYRYYWSHRATQKLSQQELKPLRIMVLDSVLFDSSAALSQFIR